MMLRSASLLLFAGGILLTADGWLFSRRRRTTVIHKTTHHNINNCVCNKVILGILGRVAALEKKVGIGRREVAALLDLDEQYPGLDEFMEHLDTKRDGLVNKEDLEDVIKRASRAVHNSNYCHCGRSIVDRANMNWM